MTATACYGIIPARYDSSRFPGKPLADIQGRPMFWHVWHRASLCPQLQQVVLATDDGRIAEAAHALDVPYVMTRSDHPSGTDRVFEAATLLQLDEDAVVVNIQGDEPALEPRMLSELVRPFAEDAAVQVTTLARAISPQQAACPDVVKVVCTAGGDALYFSRAAIPYCRDGQYGAPCMGHVGLYAFRYQALRRFTQLEQSVLERTEKLEQLRLLENNIPIRVVETAYRTHGVDRPGDIDVIINMIRENEG
ncbi:3-deoxy-manno-octulosonate cytidylyltransferase [Oleidesulfovibrio alaskensis]